jgi:hypothetical protein
METMKAPTQTVDVRLIAGSVVLAAVIFTADLLLPLGVAVPMAYVGPVLMSLWVHQLRFTVLAASVGTILTIIGYFGSPSAGPLWIVLTNRSLAILMIWMTAVIVLLYKRTQEEIKTLRGWLAICASCKKIRDDQGFWNGLEIYVEEHSEVLFTHSLCPSCTQKWYPELYPELVERHPEIYKEHE